MGMDQGRRWCCGLWAPWLHASKTWCGDGKWMRTWRWGSLGLWEVETARCRTRPKRFPRSSGSCGSAGSEAACEMRQRHNPASWCCLSIFSESFAAGWRFVGGATLNPGREVCLSAGSGCRDAGSSLVDGLGKADQDPSRWLHNPGTGRWSRQVQHAAHMLEDPPRVRYTSSCPAMSEWWETRRLIRRGLRRERSCLAQDPRTPRDGQDGQFRI